MEEGKGKLFININGKLHERDLPEGTTVEELVQRTLEVLVSGTFEIKVDGHVMYRGEKKLDDDAE
jgi:uncharacterized protein (AIM24 family)